MNKTFYTNKSRVISLGEKIGNGAEGDVYSVDRYKSECAKIYKKMPSDTLHHKLRVMVSNPPKDSSSTTNNHKSIAWPTELLYKDTKKTLLVGFLMPIVDRRFHSAHTYASPGDRIKDYPGKITWKTLLLMSHNLSSAIGALHEKGYCVGDINDRNTLIEETGLVTLIDCDSFQVKDNKSKKIFRCTVGVPDYTPPEIQGETFKNINRTIESDSFSLSIMIFQFLMEGFHPYSGKWQLSGDPLNRADKINKGLFPYGRKLSQLSPHEKAPPYEILPLEIRKLFHKCFVNGHKTPKSRPTARMWRTALKACIEDLVTCSRNKNHLFLNYLKNCPWCHRAKKLGKDYDSFISINKQAPPRTPTRKTTPSRAAKPKTTPPRTLAQGIPSYGTLPQNIPLPGNLTQGLPSPKTLAQKIISLTKLSSNIGGFYFYRNVFILIGLLVGGLSGYTTAIYNIPYVTIISIIAGALILLYLFGEIKKSIRTADDKFATIFLVVGIVAISLMVIYHKPIYISIIWALIHAFISYYFSSYIFKTLFIDQKKVAFPILFTLLLLPSLTIFVVNHDFQSPKIAADSKNPISRTDRSVRKKQPTQIRKKRANKNNKKSHVGSSKRAETISPNRSSKTQLIEPPTHRDSTGVTGILVQISSYPSNATIWIDKEKVGTTTHSLRLKSGPHGIHLSKNGYKDIWDVIKVDKNHPNKHHIRLKHE